MPNVITLKTQTATVCVCDVCKSQVRIGEEFMAVAVSRERFTAEAEVETIWSKATHYFCMGCARGYNFKRVTVPESGVMTAKEQAEDGAMIAESCRAEVAKDLGCEPSSLSHEQIHQRRHEIEA